MGEYIDLFAYFSHCPFSVNIPLYKLITENSPNSPPDDNYSLKYRSKYIFINLSMPLTSWRGRPAGRRGAKMGGTEMGLEGEEFTGISVFFLLHCVCIPLTHICANLRKDIQTFNFPSQIWPSLMKVL